MLGFEHFTCIMENNNMTFTLLVGFTLMQKQERGSHLVKLDFMSYFLQYLLVYDHINITYSQEKRISERLHISSFKIKINSSLNLVKRITT